MFQIHGADVETVVPGWLLGAAATYSTIDYMNLLASELSKDPAAYGFDPAATYTVCVQTWDCALSKVGSLAFGRHIIGQDAVGLIPDVYFMHHHGYRNLRGEAERTPAWRERRPVVAWRGSITGQGPFRSPGDIPRVKLAMSCQGHSSADVAVFGVHSTMSGEYPIDQIESFLSENSLQGEYWPMARFGDYKYVVDIDGHANAWSLLEKMILGCCVLKVDSPYEQWFYSGLKPWVHYVPLSADLSSLPSTIEWCLQNDGMCQWIAENGARFSRTLDFESQMQASCREVIRASNVENTLA